MDEVGVGGVEVGVELVVPVGDELREAVFFFEVDGGVVDEVADVFARDVGLYEDMVFGVVFK